MTQPTAGDVHVNAPLTQISIAYLQKAENFIADKVFPVVPVSQQANRYYEYKRSNWLRSQAQLRAPGSESAGGGWDLDNSATYFASVSSVHKDVADQIRSNADSVINMDRDATRWVTQQLLLKRDKDWADSYFKPGQWSVDVTPAVKWDSSLSTPVEDIRSEYYRIFENTGFKPNTLVLGARTYQALQDHPQFLDRIKFTQKAIVDTDLIASFLGLKRVLVSGSVENTAAEGAADAYRFVMGKHALLCYSAENPSLMEPTAGYTFSWSDLYGSQSSGMRVKRFRMEKLASDRVEGEMAYDLKLVASDLGSFFNSAVS